MDTASNGSSRVPHAGAGRGPLHGLVVADFARVLAGPYCTMLLGDMGATVIKVESPGGDDTRAWRPPERDGVSTYYLSINRNKRSVVLDLGDPTDLELAHELTRRADVLVQNFKPGGLRRFGLDYDAVRARNERIIYCSISGFGSEGRGASLPGYDLLVQAMSGLMSLTGDPSGPGYRSGMSAFDILAGTHGLVGILAALHARDETGLGQHVQVSLMMSALSGMNSHASAYLAGGQVPFRIGNGHPSLFPYEPLPTADEDLIIIAGNDTQFRRLCEVLGAPELAEDPRFTRAPERNRNRELLRPLLVERLRTRSADDWFEAFTAAGLPSGPINTIDAGFRYATELGLEPVVQLGEGEDAVPMARHPISFSSTPPRYDLPPPELGQDGDAVRAWLTAAVPATTMD